MIDISNVFRLGTNHTLSATTSSGATATSAFGAQTQTVMVTTTAACFVAFDPDRPATTSSTYIAAGTPYLIRVQGEGSMCSAITGASTATVYITELTR
jgi:hydroxyethylthiazole kinase-like sugar kinase family protein